MGQMQADAQKAQMGWVHLAQAQQAIYQTLGITVTIATEMHMSSSSTSLVSSRMVNVGLCFEGAEMAVTPTVMTPTIVTASDQSVVTAPPIVLTAAPMATPMERAGPMLEPAC